MSSESDYVFTTTKTTTAIATTTLPPTFEGLTNTLGNTFVHYLNYLTKVPGGDWLLWYIKASYKNDPVRSLFELALFIFGVHYFLRSKKKENKSDLVRLNKREVDELIDEWTPNVLVEELSDVERWQLNSIPVIEGCNGHSVKLSNLTKATNVINLASNDFLNLNESDEVRKAADDAINYSGVGACSAPNFYGTQDFHVRLEEDIAEYLDGEQAILYGQDMVTPSSVLPAFVKRGDLCIVDTGVSMSIQKALIVSRCDIEWFNHNDMKHLENILEEITPMLDKQKPLKRRFIVTEGFFTNDGSIANLPKIIELRKQYKYRLFLDESNSIGVVGKTGKGLTEHFDIPRSDISITVGTLAKAFASSGGFCVGETPMVHHQRLSSLAYVFSASLPPYCARTASESIKQIQKTNTDGNSILITKLQENVEFFYHAVSKFANVNKFIEVNSDLSSPIVHLSLRDSYRSSLELPEFYGTTDFLTSGKRPKSNNEFNEYYNLENFILQKIVDDVLISSNILISRSKNLLHHENLPIHKPKLMIYVNTAVSRDQLDLLSVTLERSIDSVCQRLSSKSDLDSLTNKMEEY